jgi:hypothetical protein
VSSLYIVADVKSNTLPTLFTGPLQIYLHPDMSLHIVQGGNQTKVVNMAAYDAPLDAIAEYNRRLGARESIGTGPPD